MKLDWGLWERRSTAMSKPGKGGKPKSAVWLTITSQQADDLFVRFFLNISPRKLATPEDFAVILLEAVYYHQEVNAKFYAKPEAKSLTQFAKAFFALIPPLQPYIPVIPQIVQAEGKIQRLVRPAGCICYNPALTHVLRVAHAITGGREFSFPKGKSREYETAMETAARETFEESGVDVSDYISEDLFLTYSRKGRSDVTLFHVLNVPMEREELRSPSPLEIAVVRWVPIDALESDSAVSVDPPTARLVPQVAAFAADRRGKQ
jgi:mRNA-decapping enzyme subunit 2